MANIIKPKRSNTAAKVPTTTELVSGELGVNMADRKVYINNGTAVVQVGAGNLSGLGDVAVSSPANGQALKYNSTTSKWENSAAGAGDVTGPASATDNAITRFDGTTGKTIQNSTATLDDNGNFAGVNGLTFNTSPTSPPTATGAMAWDNGDGTPYVVLNANTSLQLGQENIAKVYNGTGVTIAKGSVVAVSGAQGQRPSVVLADSDSEALSAPTLGIAAEAIANGAEGFVCTFGLVRGLNTSAFTAGQPIYLSSTAGAFTTTKPVAPQHTVALGWVISINASSGEVFVNINNGWELDELHNVLITSPASGNTLIYDATAGVWKNANLTQGTGISITNGAGSITVANAGVTSVSGGTTGLTPASATTGAVTLAGTLAIANGGTGATTRQNAMDALAGAVTSGQYLRGNGTDVVMSAIQAADIPTLNQNTTGNAATATSAGTVTGWNAPPSTGNGGGTWPQLVGVKSDAVAEMGRFIDFHATSGDSSDYTVRLDGGGTGSQTLKLFGDLEVTKAVFSVQTFSLGTTYGTQSNFDVTNTSVTLANTGFIDMSNMSGMLVINNWTTGGVSIWLCGGGGTNQIGTVSGGAGMSVSYNSGINGYTIQNFSGATLTLGIFKLRTRPGA